MIFQSALKAKGKVTSDRGDVSVLDLLDLTSVLDTTDENILLCLVCGLS